MSTSSISRYKPLAIRILPVILVAAALAAAALLPARGPFPFNGKLVACQGYGYGYGYAGGPPSVTSVAPTAGPSTGGTTVAITGQGFCGGGPTTAVTFGGTPAASFTVNDDTSITAVSPAHAPGTVDVQVTNTLGTSATSAADQFTFTAFTCYFNWFDKASAGFLNDNIHLTNTSGSTAHVIVTLGTSSVSTTIAAGATTYVTFPSGSIGGPVIVNSDQTIISSQRVQFDQSFNEQWCATAAQASTKSYINWFDKASAGFVNVNVHVLNPGNTTSNVTVSLGGQSTTVAVGSQSETYVTFPSGTIGGPVVITVNSGPAVLASERTQFMNSFNENWSQPGTLGATTNLLNWYDKASTGFLNVNVHIVNPGATTATVDVILANTPTQHTTVAAGAETYVTFPQGSIGGPVTVSSDVPVLASERTQFNQSFNEVWAMSPTAAMTTSHLNWTDHASAGFVNVNIHLLNPGATSASVTINLPGSTVTAVVPAHSETYVPVPSGTIGGPVTITSTVPILGAQRTQFQSTFNEIWTV